MNIYVNAYMILYMYGVRHHFVIEALHTKMNKTKVNLYKY